MDATVGAKAKRAAFLASMQAGCVRAGMQLRTTRCVVFVTDEDEQARRWRRLGAELIRRMRRAQ